MERSAGVSNSFSTAAPKNASLLSTLATFVIGTQVFNLASAWLLPVVSEFTIVGDNISELVLGQFGFVQTAAFVLIGLAALMLAYAIRRLTRGSLGSFTGSLLIAINSLGLFVVAAFPTDRIDAPADVWNSSPTGLVHIFASVVSLTATIAAMFILTFWTFRRDARWRRPFWWVFCQQAPLRCSSRRARGR
ncbi:MAG: DUF998 domain-containing protein [Pyrinomonadaceae bacterium]